VTNHARGSKDFTSGYRLSAELLNWLTGAAGVIEDRNLAGVAVIATFGRYFVLISKILLRKRTDR
jgi:hypothetical protein